MAGEISKEDVRHFINQLRITAKYFKNDANIKSKLNVAAKILEMSPEIAEEETIAQDISLYLFRIKEGQLELALARMNSTANVIIARANVENAGRVQKIFAKHSGATA